MTGDMAKVRCITPCGAFNGIIRRESRKVMMMKIGKCKKELARIISEHGGWRDGYGFSAQDGDDCAVWFYDNAPVRSSGAWWVTSGSGLGYCGIKDVAKLPNWHQTILSSDEYFHLYPAPDADGWIEWNGGECPVEKGTLVDVRFKDGMEMVGAPAGQTPDHFPRNMTAWARSSAPGAIIAYRLHKQQPKPEFCESVMRTIPEPEAKPTIDQLLQDWRNADDLAKRKQAEADEAAAMRDERWSAVQVKASEMGVVLAQADSEIGPAKPAMTGKFRNAKIGSPKHYISNKGWSNEICDECGKRFGAHFDTDCNPQ